MIEKLSGIHETVNFKQNTQIRLYENTQTENYPSHWHTPFEIIMPLKNTYKVICNEHSHHLNENDILIISPGSIHQLIAPADGHRLIFQIYLEITPPFKELEPVLSMLSPAALITAAAQFDIHASLHKLMLEIQKEYHKNTPFSSVTIYTIFLKMLITLGQNHTQNIRQMYAGNTKQEEFIQKFSYLCNYITEHCAEELSLTQVAAFAGFSKYHFTRLFKQFTNVSFYQYLNQKRMLAAKNLLLEPTLSITDVASRSGFPSVTSFIRMFKLMNHCTPTEFRKMYIRGH